jgi:hypothetical protein
VGSALVSVIEANYTKKSLGSILRKSVREYKNATKNA